MENLTAEFSFKIPEGHEEAGKKITKSFDYEACESEDEAQAVIEKKKWSLADLVNEALKRNARSAAYQSATLPYKASDVPPEDIQERMIRDYIRLGWTEENARKHVMSATPNQA